MQCLQLVKSISIDNIIKIINNMQIFLFIIFLFIVIKQEFRKK
jgi:hypothetical protein